MNVTCYIKRKKIISVKRSRKIRTDEVAQKVMESDYLRTDIFMNPKKQEQRHMCIIKIDYAPFKRQRRGLIHEPQKEKGGTDSMDCLIEIDAHLYITRRGLCSCSLGRLT